MSSTRICRTRRGARRSGFDSSRSTSATAARSIRITASCSSSREWLEPGHAFQRDRHRRVKTHWGYLLVAPFAISAVLLIGSQWVFLQQSFYPDLAFGRKAAHWSFANYARILTDAYYLRTLWLTTWISLCVAAACIGFGF